MIIKTKTPVSLNGTRFDVTDVKMEKGKLFLNMGWRTICEMPLKDVNALTYEGKDIIRNGKTSFECSHNCNACPFKETRDLNIYIRPSTYRIEKIFYCGWKERYSTDIEKLPTSRMKSTYDLKLRKAYDGLKEKYHRKGVKHITDKSIEECVNEIEDSMTPNSDGEAYNEYGHYYIELKEVEIRRNKYGFSVYHSGSMGDYGWTQTILVHGRCDTDRLYGALRDRYGDVVSSDI